MTHGRRATNGRKRSGRHGTLWRGKARWSASGKHGREKGGGRGDKLSSLRVALDAVDMIDMVDS